MWKIETHNMRQVYALVAMFALIMKEDLTDGEQATPKSVAEGAFAFADAMVEQEKRKGS